MVNVSCVWKGQGSRRTRTQREGHTRGEEKKRNGGEVGGGQTKGGGRVCMWKRWAGGEGGTHEAWHQRQVWRGEPLGGISKGGSSGKGVLTKTGAGR